MTEDFGGLNIPIGDLIDELAPLNNQMRAATRSHQPAYVSIELMWDMGEILIASEVERIHPLAWAVAERSYITRDLLSYCFRIRNYFGDRAEIKTRFGQVPVYGIFREAFPLLDNQQFKLDTDGERELIALMVSDRSTKQVKDEIIAMKKRLIGRDNPRTQRLAEVEPFAGLFSEKMAELDRLMESGTADQIDEFRHGFDDVSLFYLSKLCLSLSSDSFSPPKEPLADSPVVAGWSEFLSEMHALACAGKESRSRVRRLVSPKEFVRMGSYVDMLRSDEKLKRYVANRKRASS